MRTLLVVLAIMLGGCSSEPTADQLGVPVSYIILDQDGTEVVQRQVGKDWEECGIKQLRRGDIFKKDGKVYVAKSKPSKRGQGCVLTAELAK